MPLLVPVQQLIDLEPYLPAYFQQAAEPENAKTGDIWFVEGEMPDVKIKKPDGTFLSIKGPKGDASTEPGPAGRSIQVFEQPDEPATAQPGDIWIDTDAP